MMTDERKIELLCELLSAMIAGLGYPVGCGVAPHPETVEKMAQNCLRVATAAEVTS